MLFKCKMCGGELNIADGTEIALCEYCGSKQTLPRFTDERRSRLYDRAGHFRRNNEFDKAMALYEEILSEDDTDAEAYWSIILCKYGIEYIDDVRTKRRVPTVNRAQFTSVFDDDNYKSALKYASMEQRLIYEREALEINEIQKGIIEISRREEPFDIFICYKETDGDGGRTHDSVMAQELYYRLCEEGYKVFFSRITLEGKLGVAYEPYIFAALNSARVMLAIGTRAEHFDSPWVKNEWGRFLSLIKASGGKKALIPVYKDMSAYDLPSEFSHLQAQDMSKIGFMQDLLYGIKKLMPEDGERAHVGEEAERGANSEKREALQATLRRVEIFIGNGYWKSADEYCERVLDIDPENATAYIYKLMARLHVKKEEDIAHSAIPLSDLPEYINAVSFADTETVERLIEYNEAAVKRLARKESKSHRQKEHCSEHPVTTIILSLFDALLSFLAFCFIVTIDKDTGFSDIVLGLVFAVPAIALGVMVLKRLSYNPFLSVFCIISLGIYPAVLAVMTAVNSVKRRIAGSSDNDEVIDVIEEITDDLRK